MQGKIAVTIAILTLVIGVAIGYSAGYAALVPELNLATGRIMEAKKIISDIQSQFTTTQTELTKLRAELSSTRAELSKVKAELLAKEDELKKTGLILDVTKEAKVEKIEMYFGTIDGFSGLIFLIHIKNLADRPLGFDASVRIPGYYEARGGTGAGGAYGEIKPGEVGRATVPVTGPTTYPQSVTITISVAKPPPR
ncbi:MAG: hypothetical protein N3F06_02620 [Nitrososphaerales archaeon]|nr:hypothetical protein [Nitrososphaerales archaeon]